MTDVINSELPYLCAKLSFTGSQIGFATVLCIIGVINMIKAVFFDFDGVLTLAFSGATDVCNNLCSMYPELDFDFVRDCYKRHIKPIIVKPGPNIEVWDEFSACIGKEVTPDAIRKLDVNEKMFDLAKSLKSNYKVGIITNQSARRIDLVRKDLNLDSIFDPIIVSAEVGVKKKDDTTKIFDIALECADCGPEEAVFIDNQAKNLVDPGKMGFKTYWHDDSKNDIPKLCTELERFGVICPKSF